jgi:hypothetical protein
MNPNATSTRSDRFALNENLKTKKHDDATGQTLNTLTMESTIMNATNATWEYTQSHSPHISPIDDLNVTTNNPTWNVPHPPPQQQQPNDESPPNSVAVLVTMIMILIAPVVLTICIYVWMVVRFARHRHEDPNALSIPVIDFRTLAPADRSTKSSRKEREHKRLDFIHKTLITHTLDGFQAPEDNNEKEEAPDEATVSISSGDIDVDGISDLGSMDSKNSCSDDVCSICLASFHRDSIVCESNNLACCHQYHEECMIGWLMKHDVCPICRERYLIESV